MDSPQSCPLPLLHASELPGLSNDGAEQENDSGVVEPKNEKDDSSDVGIPALTLQGGEVREIEPVQSFG
jgi:hypothetical protein